MLAVSKGVLLATFLVPLVVLSAWGAAEFRADRISLGCKAVHTSTDSLMSMMHVVDINDLQIHVDEKSIDDMLKEAGTIAYRLLRGGVATFGFARFALGVMCGQPQDSGQVMLCNLMKLTFEAIEDELVAPLRSLLVDTIIAL